MTIDDQLNFCRACFKRKFNPQVGIVCSLTEAKPTFELSCPDFDIDKEEAARLAQQERLSQVEEASSSGFFAAEKVGIEKGTWGGIIMMVIAVIWFFGGLAAGYIFFYPPILFIIGIVALVKGIAKGSGSRY